MLSSFFPRVMKSAATFLLLMCLAAEGSTAPERVDWARLRGLNFKTGRVTADVKALDGAEVRIPGFMVPFDEHLSEATEFVLVPNCIHVPGRPNNQVVLVKMDGGKKTPVWLGKSVWVQGKL